MKNKSPGAGLVELIIAVGVVGMVLTSIAAAMLLSVKNSAQAKFSQIATTQAQQAMEIFVRENVLLTWEDFQTIADNGSYCFNSLPEDSSQFFNMPVGLCSTGYLVAENNFKRQVEIIRVSADEIQVEVTVSWLDGTQDHQVVLTQNFDKNGL